MSSNNRKFYKKSWPKKWTKPAGDCEVRNYEVETRHGYAGFQLYFTEKDPDDINTALANVRSFESYVYRNVGRFAPAKIKESKVYEVDYGELLRDDELSAEWDSLEDDLRDRTEQTLQCMGLAVHQALTKHYDDPDAEAKRKLLPVVRCRLTNHTPVVQIKNLSVKYYDKLISVKGTVIRATAKSLRCEYLAFACSTCDGSQIVKQTHGDFSAPTRCASKGCRAGKNFLPLVSHPHNRTVATQVIKLATKDQDGASMAANTVECELVEDLVGCCEPGDDVTVTGVIRARKATDVSQNKYLLYLDAVNVKNDKNGSTVRSHPEIVFDSLDYEAIRKIHAEPNLFRLLVHSLCPAIYGHEVVKAGLLLCLFGGTRRNVNVRSDSHMLMVGDPGLGKSRLLQACANVAPRGVYVCGNTSTVSGLTVTMTRESGGDYALEAGALVLADRGCCCIDEFDKMKSQHACLLEAMEQQRISLAKAGVQCSIPTQTSILAAANPADGHYNKGKTVFENLKISPPLLSRFDLVFIILDQPNEELDMLLSEHILGLLSGSKSSSYSTPLSSRSGSSQLPVTLKQMLKVEPGETIDCISHELLRKYIAYAHKYLHPVLNREAQNVLLKFYVELRKQYQKGDSTPITARQLESMIRLTQARAKLELREEATAEDAVVVVEIMRHSLVDIFVDQMGVLNFTRSQNGSGVSNKKLINKFLKLLQRKADVVSKSTFTLDELKDLGAHVGVSSTDFNTMLDSMNLQGYLLKKPGKLFQLCI